MGAFQSPMFSRCRAPQKVKKPLYLLLAGGGRDLTSWFSLHWGTIRYRMCAVNPMLPVLFGEV